MGLSNTLFAGMSGLNANQTRLNVIGNNIANANTVAFKSTRSLFMPQFYVTDSGGSQPTDQSGGTNPSQRGLGVAVSALEKNFTQGSIETTGRTTDLALDGTGFFIVNGDETRYTRDGSFRLNAANQLVTSTGEFVQGYGVDQNFNLQTGSIGNLTIPLNAATTAQATSTAQLKGNLDADGQIASGASVILGSNWTVSGAAPTAATLLTSLQDADGNSPFAAGDALTLAARKGGQNLATTTFDVTGASTVGDLASFMQTSLGIDTAVPDLGIPTVPVPGVTVEADSTDPTYGHLTIAGNTGSTNNIELSSASLKKADGTTVMSFATGTNAAGISDNPAGESVRTNFLVYDSLGSPMRMDVSLVKESENSNGTTWRFYAESSDNLTANGVVPVIGSGTLTFGNDGKLRASTGTQLTLNRINTGATTPLAVTMDFSQMTSLASKGSDLAMTYQDGSPIGRLSAFSIGQDGIVTGMFSNGVTRTVGQLAIATFTNPQGLIDRGGNMYIEGPNSGSAAITTPGTLGVGKVVSGALELSNVDLSEEFINMIIASTGYTASSRVITATDQLITELLNTTR